MESLSKQELISTLTKQADQIKRYEARLRDVVTAYKGLIKEKEALEISLKALNKTESPTKQDNDSVATLTLSLSTLTAEKTRLEEAFQADKKVTRDKYENIIASMKEETKTLIQQHFVEINNLKAKIGYEIQEREKERADHAAMMKELHIKLNSERITKEKLEDKVVHSTEAQASQAELEKRVRDLSSSLEASQRRLQRAEARTVETPALLVRLQQKLALLEQSHSIAIREEQIKAKRAEESARKICAKQEERVALLEGRLAELSQTIGEYDLRRRRDQQTIRQLKDSVNGSILDKISPAGEYESGHIHDDVGGEKQDKMDTIKLYEEKMKNEQEYHKEVNSDLKARVQSLEKQVGTQRDRYAALLDETDNLIRSRNDRSRKVSVEESWKEGVIADNSAPPHMLHYAHELARKDLDISQLRKEKHTLEGQYRDCQRDATIEKERFKEVVRTLKEEIDRLRRSQSREGANLEYLKNVVISYLMSADYAGRKHMLNAIAAVLHFTSKEKNMVLSTIR
ncbi:hypothetical protein ACJJTC_006842 [Scirpophaga incertulas]